MSAPREHMQKEFIQRREQVVGDLVQLTTDVEVCNDMHSHTAPIQLPLDFTHDVDERKTG